MNYHHYGPSPGAPYDRYHYSSPPYGDEYVHYVPAYGTTPTRKHSRNKSYAESPRVGGWHSSPGAPPAYHEDYVYHTNTPRKDAYVSYDRRPPPAYGMPPPPEYARHTRKPSQPIYFFDDDAGYAEPSPKYYYREPPPTAKTPSPNKHGKNASTNSYYYYPQAQAYEDTTPKRTRPRANTGTPRSAPKHKRAASHPVPSSVPQATEKDALNAGIPAGYSIKNWDPTEKPIILLGSVFDANSLGKWIYDWTVFHLGASTPLADVAGELWLLLIKLAGKTKRSEDVLRRIRNVDDREMIEDFIKSGLRLWEKFKSLLKDCQYYMMKAAKREGSKTMGKNAGTEFVDSIFGRDRYLDQTEKIMASIRMWNMRFDVNCEDILRRRSAA